MKLTQSHIERMKQARDVKSLIEALVDSKSESIRVLAADALGDLGDVESVETLAQAALWDQSEDVRSVAHEALESIVGNQVDEVLESYRANPPEGRGDTDEEEVEDGTEEDESGKDEEEAAWSEGDLNGLIMVLEGEPNLSMKLKAVEALGQIDDTRATLALARATFVDDEPILQKAAHRALENIFGDVAQDYIDSVWKMDLQELEEEEEGEDTDEGDAGDIGEEDVEDEEEGDVAESAEEDETPAVPSYAPARPAASQPPNPSPVVEWDDPRKRILLPLIIGLVVVGAIIAALVFLR